MIPAIPFVGLAVTATVAYAIKKGCEIAELILGRPERDAEREHALSDLRKLRESMEIERAKMQAMAKPGSNPRTFKSN